MKTCRKTITTLLLTGILLTTTTHAAILAATVTGVLGMTDVQDRACIAVWVPLADDEAITHVNWYNNDGTIVFPELLLSAGQEDGPGLLDDATVAVEDLQGASDGWSAAVLPEPVASTVDGLYVLFRLPLGSVQVARGAGGGAGMGYEVAEGGPTAWLTVDGVDWIRLHESIRLGFEVEKAAADLTTLRLERAVKTSIPDTADDETPVLVNAFHKPSPNPFNPMTTLRFSTRKAGPLTLELFDVKGRRVATPASGEWSAGAHEVEWTGRTDDDRPLPSGVYLARLKTREFEATQRLVLIR